jgi:ribonucleoside-diphosphate reductase alpha chain
MGNGALKEVDSDARDTKGTVREGGIHPHERGLRVDRFFSRRGVHPYDEIEWEIRDARIQGSGEGGDVVFFEQKGVEFPGSWSQNASNIVAGKYFRGKDGTARRERSVRQMISRVVDTVSAWGFEDGYFHSAEDRDSFEGELTHLLLMQKASFNSPVWFNVGVEKKPQCSACFILSVEDTMESILEWYKTEGMIFKGGSGSGVNISSLRSSREHMSTGGLASGPVSFMRGADAIAGTIKSGGKTRRAAKMVILDASHPDIMEFIWTKVREEKKVKALGDAGYDLSLDSDVWISIQYQNANNSVRVSDDFMTAAAEDRDWVLKTVKTGEPVETLPARDILKAMAEAAWACADPGIQYHTTINRWHTCPNSGPIRASNPCSEYMHLDDSACNLASLNLLTFLRDDGSFDVESFTHAVSILILAQEIIVSRSSYPTDRIGRNAATFRQLGLGFANLGALLMAKGLAYDSEGGRAYAASVTSLMCGEAYRNSALIAAVKGPFEGYPVNREPMLDVIRMHRDAAYVVPEIDDSDLLRDSRRVWDDALSAGEKYGYRNAQATVIAPTGTIGLQMDCDTTGIEPEIALIKYKSLVGGGSMKFVNRTVSRSLSTLGYSEGEIEDILRHIEENGGCEGAPHLKAEHLPVFDTAFRPAGGTRFLSPMAHLKMMGAIQPFISGAISKTVNVPEETTPGEIVELFIDGWRMGLKAFAIYRDNSKAIQIISTSSKTASGETVRRRRLPDERQALTHKFSVGGCEGYLTVGLFEDGTPGEVFLTISKEGSTISGLFDVIATQMSLLLQYGVPLQDLVRKFANSRFDPAGITSNADIRFATSIIDYVVRWLGNRYLSPEELEDAGQLRVPHYPSQGELPMDIPGEERGTGDANSFHEGPPCTSCGSIMFRAGSCYTCPNCGSTTGCS